MQTRQSERRRPALVLLAALWGVPVMAADVAVFAAGSLRAAGEPGLRILAGHGFVGL